MSMTLGELLRTVPDADVDYQGCAADTVVEGLEVDSREVQAGAAFLAVAGVESDGHRYVKDARDRGAAALIVQRDMITDDPGFEGPRVVLRSSSEALPIIAGNATGWPGRALRLAGITGTNGKTTTTYFVAGALEAAQRTYARLGTTGHWLADRPAPTGYTTPFPLDLQRLLATARDRGATDAVMEVSSHGLDQDRVAPLSFDAVALTSFSQDHLDYHPTMEAYLDAKLRLASTYGKAGGIAAAPVEIGDPAERFLSAAQQAGMQTYRVSRTRADAEIVAVSPRLDAGGITCEVLTPVGRFDLSTPLVGAYNLDNALVATAMGIGLGLPLEAIAQGLTRAHAPGRLERVEVEGAPGPAVFVDYAHTPDAVARALAALRPSVRGELWVVLGCGGDRDPKKRPMMARAAIEGSDRFFATSDNPRTEDPAAIVDQMIAEVSADHRVVRVVDRAQAIAQAIAAARPEDTVLIAGKGHEDYQIIGTEKIAFDDREHARTALQRLVR